MSRRHSQQTCKTVNKTTVHIAVLVAIILLVHLLYELWILPEVNILVAIAKDSGDLLPRNFFVIVKDLEQENVGIKEALALEEAETEGKEELKEVVLYHAFHV